MRSRNRFQAPSCAERMARAAAEMEAEKKPERWLLRSPAWATAIALHILAAVVLMNIVRFTTRPTGGNVFRLSFSAARPVTPGGDEQGDQDNGVNGKDNEDSSPGVPAAAPPAANLPPVQERAGVLQLPGLASAAPTATAFGNGGLFAGRGGAGRGEALRRYGGDASTETAVESALEWLAGHQDHDGGWGAAPCRHRDCTQVASHYRIAISGLALLSFLAHGHTHAAQDDPRAEIVQKAMKYLLKRQSEDGYFTESPKGFAECMYTHGIATFALAELYAMTQEPLLRDPLQKAVQACADAQQSTGGWDYSPKLTTRSDLSISNWHVQALRAARLGGIAVPKPAWEAARRLYRGAAMKTSASYPYQVMKNYDPSPGTCAVTAACALASHYLELLPDQDFDRRIAERLASRVPVYGEAGKDGTNDSNGGWVPTSGGHYFTYYATLFLFHAGGDQWTAWNSKMKRILTGAQEKTGPPKGSWAPEPTDANGVGRVFSTALAALDLQIYYRYLPTTGRDGTEMGGLFEEKTRSEAELLKALGDERGRTRVLAGRELARRQTEGAGSAILQAAETSEGGTRAQLLQYLALFPASDELLDRILAILSRDSDEEVQQAATEALRRLTGANLTTAAQWRSWMMNRKNLKARQAEK